MNDIDYIIRTGRTKINFEYLFPIIINLFSIIGLSFAVIWITEDLMMKYLIIIFSFVIIILVCFLHFKSLIHRISFYRYVNNSKNSLVDIVSEISVKFSLKLYKENNGFTVFKMNYYLPFGFWIFKTKKDITLIAFNNEILLNICNSNKSVLYNFKDLKAEQINFLLEEKMCQKGTVENYIIFEPYNHLFKN